VGLRFSATTIRSGRMARRGQGVKHINFCLISQRTKQETIKIIGERATVKDLRIRGVTFHGNEVVARVFDTVQAA
jgi:hypothetical protein